MQQVNGHDEELVNYVRDGAIGYIKLNRPRKLNAFSDELVRALKRALDTFDQDDLAQVGILHGAGTSFSSGADVQQRQLRSREELERYGGPEAPDARWGEIMYQTVNSKPIIAAVHGYVLGMAVGLALQCDLVVAAADTKFQITEVPRGLHGSRYWALLRYRGAGSFADDVALTGRFFSGEEALAAGVLNQVVANGHDHVAAATELAQSVCANPPLAIRSLVRARRWDLKRFEDNLSALRDHQPALHLTGEFQASARAFADGHRPATDQ